MLSQAQKLEDLEATVQALAAAERWVDNGDAGGRPPGMSQASAPSAGLCASRDKYDGSIRVRFSLLKESEGSLQDEGDSPLPEDTQQVWLNRDMKCPRKVGT